MFAWIFVNERLPHGEPLPRFGEVRSMKPPVALHRVGLHGAFDVFDAMVVGSGPLLCFVKAEGVIHADKHWVCSTQQRFVNVLDARATLLEFGRYCCRQADSLWDAPSTVRDWLESGDATLAEGARLEAAAAVAGLPQGHPGRSVARAVVQVATPHFEAHQAAQAAAFNAQYAMAAECSGVEWTAARDAAEDDQRAEFNRLVGIALSLDLQKGGIMS